MPEPRFSEGIVKSYILPMREGEAHALDLSW